MVVVLFSRPVVSDPLQPHGLQHTKSWTRLGDWAATWFALLGHGVRNQQMGLRCAHCCWGVTASRPS